MTTQSDIDAIKRMLDRKQTVPAQMIRSLAMKAENLLTICNQQGKEIERLKAEQKQQQTPEYDRYDQFRGQE
jgi:hypothetical protein